MFLRLISKEKPEYIAVAFDLPAPTFRKKLFPDYKANRAAMPDKLRKQIPVIRKIISSLNVPVFELEGYEADDILGTLAKLAEKRGVVVRVFTRDKDCLQLITPNVKIVKENSGAVMDAEKVMQRFGVEPGRLVEIWGLSGDVSDNVPGVPGIGEKTALRLIQEFGSIENLLDNLGGVGNTRVREKLEEFSDLAKLSKKLVTIDCNVPICCDFESCKRAVPDTEGLKQIFGELEFKKLLDPGRFNGS